MLLVLYLDLNTYKKISPPPRPGAYFDWVFNWALCALIGYLQSSHNFVDYLNKNLYTFSQIPQQMLVFAPWRSLILPGTNGIIFLNYDNEFSRERGKYRRRPFFWTFCRTKVKRLFIKLYWMRRFNAIFSFCGDN